MMTMSDKKRNRGVAMLWAIAFSFVIFALTSLLITLMTVAYQRTRISEDLLKKQAIADQIGEYYIRCVNSSGEFPAGSETARSAYTKFTWMDSDTIDFFMDVHTRYGFTYLSETCTDYGSFWMFYRENGYSRRLTVKDDEGNGLLYVIIQEDVKYSEKTGLILTRSANPISTFTVKEWSTTDYGGTYEADSLGLLQSIWKWLGSAYSSSTMESNMYNVTLDPNGGSLSSETGKCFEDQEIILPKNNYKTGYNFVGWKSSRNNQVYQPGSAFVVKNDVTFTAQWEAYTVTFVNDGATLKTCTADNFSWPILDSTTGFSSKSEYDFVGWVTYDAASDTYGDIQYGPDTGMNPNFVLKANTVLRAKWVSKPRCSINFYEADMVTIKVTDSIPVDNSINFRRVTTKDNLNEVIGHLKVHFRVDSKDISVSSNQIHKITTYNFAGWKIGKNGTKTYGINDTYVIPRGTETIDLYPVFTVNTVTKETVAATFPSDPTKPTVNHVAYTFAGWSYNGSIISSYSANTPQEINVDATWTTDIDRYDFLFQPEYANLSIVNNKGESLTGNTIAGVPYGSSVTVNDATVIFDASATGHDIGSNNSGVTWIKVTATAKNTAQHSWSRWYNDATDSTIRSFTVTEDSVSKFISRWITNKYTLSFDAGTGAHLLNSTATTLTYTEEISYGSTISVDGNTMKIKGYNTNKSFSIACNNNYQILSWNVNNTVISGTQTFKVKGNVSVSVNYDTLYTVTIDGNTYGTVDGQAKQYKHMVTKNTVISCSGNTVTVGGTTYTVTANSGYAFTGWTNGTATVTGNLTVTANYVPTYTVTVNAGSHGKITSGTGTVTNVPKDSAFTVSGSTITVFGSSNTVTADSGYAFTGWKIGTTAVSTGTKVTGNVTVTAQYSQVFTVTIQPGSYATIDNKTTAVTINNVPSGASLSSVISQVTNGSLANATVTVNGTAHTLRVNSGYMCTKWIDSAGNSLPSTVTANLTVQPYCQQYYTVTFTETRTKPDGTNVPTSKATVNYVVEGTAIQNTTSSTATTGKNTITLKVNGTSVSFTPDTGYEWNTLTNGTATVNENITVTAKYKAKMFTVSTSSGGGSNEGSCKLYYKNKDDTQYSSNTVTFGKNGVGTSKKVQEGGSIYYADATNLSAATISSASWSSGQSNAKTVSSDISINFTATSTCLANGTLITMADGTTKQVQDIKAGDMVLVWNLEKGCYDSAPIVFNEAEPESEYEVVRLCFSDGTEVGIVSEHGFFDVDSARYVYLDSNAADYIGHRFVQYADNGKWNVVTLTDVKITTEYLSVYSPVSFGALNIYANGMLSMPGGIDGIFNIYDVDTDTMKYDAEKKQADIEKYGQLTFADFGDMITEDMFYAFNGADLNVAIGKGILTWDRIAFLANRYGPVVEEQNPIE